MDLLVDAVLNMECGTSEQLIQATAGVMKIGDIASDIFFIMAMNEYWGEASSPYYDDAAVYISAIVFTSVGIFFDLIKFAVSLRDHCRRKKLEQEGQDVSEAEEKQRDWKCWKRSNFVFEEFPQLVIAVAFVFNIDYDSFIGNEDGLCSPEQLEHYYKARNSAIVSLLFTIYSLSTTLYLWIKHCRRKADHVERGI